MEDDDYNWTKILKNSYYGSLQKPYKKMIGIVPSQYMSIIATNWARTPRWIMI